MEFAEAFATVYLDDVPLPAAEGLDHTVPGPFVRRLADAILDYELFRQDGDLMLRTTRIELTGATPTETIGRCRAVSPTDAQPLLAERPPTTIGAAHPATRPDLSRIAALLAMTSHVEAILYEEGAAGETTPELEATIAWRIVSDPGGPIIAATIEVPERHMTILFSIQENHNSAFGFSHEIDFLVTIDPNYTHPAGGIASIGTLAVKTTEDAIGEPIVGRSQSLPPDFFWIELDPAALSQNINRLRSRDWFDLGIVYANGQRAILTFEKGPDGRQVFLEALTAWAAN
ncbi:MAG: hypothetical protein KIS68_03845 [Bauldia sp.]|nr:hypothetical protein [Bauldia sp.]